MDSSLVLSIFLLLLSLLLTGMGMFGLAWSKITMRPAVMFFMFAIVSFVMSLVIRI